jgi:ankyrin repeat protein
MKNILFVLCFTLIIHTTQAQQSIWNACREGDKTMVESLLKQGVSIDTQDHKGFTPLILAVYNQQTDLVKYLLEKGANPNIADASGNTALMGASFKGYTEIAQLLLEKRQILIFKMVTALQR